MLLQANFGPLYIVVLTRVKRPFSTQDVLHHLAAYQQLHVIVLLNRFQIIFAFYLTQECLCDIIRNNYWINFLTSEGREMDSNERKALLVRAGISQVSIARALRCSPEHVCQVLSGKTKSSRTRRYIARAVGKTEKALWPEAA